MNAPIGEHLSAMKWILHYLKGTIDYGLLIKKSSPHIYSYVDWAECPIYRKWTSGYIYICFLDFVVFPKTKIHIELKHRSRIPWCGRCSCWRDIDSELIRKPRVDDHVPCVRYDNLGAIYLMVNLVLHFQSQHVEMDIQFIHDLVGKKDIKVNHITAADQMADGLIKPFSNASFILFWRKINIGPILFFLRGVLRNAVFVEDVMSYSSGQTKATDSTNSSTKEVYHISSRNNIITCCADNVEFYHISSSDNVTTCSNPNNRLTNHCSNR